MRSPNPAYCRVSVLAPTARVDVALPVDVPVAELVPMLLELLGEPAPTSRPAGWRLGGVAGGPLPPDATLAELGVPDGELLRLAPVSVPPPPPVFDDPVDALAATTAGAPVAPRGRVVAAVLATVTVAAMLLPVVRQAGGDVALVITLGVAATVAAFAGMALARPRDGDRRLPVAMAVAAALLGAGSAAAAVPGAPGAAHALAAAATAGTVAALAQLVLREIAPVLVALVVVAFPVAVAAVAQMWFGVPPAHLAAAVAALALSIGPLLARASLRLAGAPRPVIPGSAAELVAADTGPDLLPAAELAERARLARGYLAGGAAGTATLAAAAALPVATGGGWSGVGLAVITVVVLALRSRGFTDPVPVLAHQLAALGAGLAVAVGAALTAEPYGRLAVVTGLVVAAAVGALVAARPERPVSPVTRRALDIVEGLFTCAAVPLAIGVMGVYGVVRAL